MYLLLTNILSQCHHCLLELLECCHSLILGCFLRFRCSVDSRYHGIELVEDRQVEGGGCEQVLDINHLILQSELFKQARDLMLIAEGNERHIVVNGENYRISSLKSYHGLCPTIP